MEKIDMGCNELIKSIDLCDIKLPCKDCITLSICLSKYNIYFKNNSRMCSNNIDYLIVKSYSDFSSKFYSIDKIIEYSQKINRIENYYIIKYIIDLLSVQCSILNSELFKTLKSYNDIIKNVNLNQIEISTLRRIIIYKLIKNSLSDYLNIS